MDLAALGLRLTSLRALVDNTLERLMPDAGEAPHRLHAAMRYALLSPGKRIRPVLALLTAEQLGCAAGRALAPACALEMVHAASLVLDDLPCMDDSDTRRGQPSVHVRYGEDLAVLAGVALLNEAFAVIAGAPQIPDSARVQMIALLSRTVGMNGLVGGQESDLSDWSQPSLGALSQMHDRKTGVLFVASVEMGALAAGAGPDEMQALRAFARELGLAYQALDDLQDEAEIAMNPHAAANLVAVLGRDGVRDEARTRIDLAKAALRRAGPQMEPMGLFVDHLLGQAAGGAP